MMDGKTNPTRIKADFGFSVPIQIRFSDIDVYLHVNNGVFFNYFEHARALYLCQSYQWDFLTLGAVVANIDMDFLQPIHLQDVVQAYVRCISIGNSSFLLEQALLGKKEGGNEVVFATARTTMVTIDLKTMKSRSIPEEYAVKIRKLERLEG